MLESSEQKEKISGTILKVLFRNAESGFHILKVHPGGNKPVVTVLGTGHNTLERGHKISAVGSWEKDKKYGRQFRTQAIQSTLPTDDRSIVKYLSSGIFTGIGPINAQKIVDRFGRQIFDVLDNSPERLDEVKGLSKKAVDSITVAWATQSGSAKTLTKLHEYGISNSLVRKIYKKQGANALNILAENPYQLVDEIWGIGFIKADEIARNNGMEQTDSKRVRAGISYTLKLAAENGSCGLKVDHLVEDAAELLKIDPDLVREYLSSLTGDMAENIKIKRHEDADTAFLKRYYSLENLVAGKLKQINCQRVPWNSLPPKVAVSQARRLAEVTLTKRQEEAVELAFASNLTVITGGPGVGKTTLTNALLKVLKSNRLEVKLCAPTGTAAKRLGKATLHSASTIHVTLGFNPVTRKMKHDHYNPLECDVVIVDEVSMIDIELMASLVQAIGPQTALILLGDVDQLPSIGPGNVLRDIINSGVVPAVFLREIFRQAANSRIIAVSRAIREGKMPSLESGQSDDFFFIRTSDQDKCLNLICRLILERIPEKFGLDPVREIQVLSPMKNGTVGINNLNDVLQKKLNPDAPVGLIHRNRRFALGDKVIQTQNDYVKNVFNGDIGYIASIKTTDKKLTVDFDGSEVDYDHDELETIDPAFAITIHKSQGSEYPAAIVPIMMQHRIMMQRKLIYTGITRGKLLTVVLGEPKALEIAVKNVPLGKNFSRPRISRLAGLLAS